MATPVTMPVLGLTMEEGTVAEWLKHEGDAVAKDEPLLTVEMDKGIVEVPSPAAGVLRRIVVQPGTTVPVRDADRRDRRPERSPGAARRGGGGSTATRAQAADGRDPPAAARAISPRRAERPRCSVHVSHTEGRHGVGRPIAHPRRLGGPRLGERLFASPRARMRARALSVDLRTLDGTGPHGRIVEADVLGAVRTTAETRVLVTPLARRLAEEHGVAIDDRAGQRPGRPHHPGRRAARGRPRSRQRRAADATSGLRPHGSTTAELAAPGRRRSPALSRMRRITAERMAASSQATARVTLFLDADFSEAARFRDQLQPEFARLGIAKLPWDALIAKAAALALQRASAPSAAQWVDGQGLRQAETISVGVAVALEPEGLVVPVLKDAATRSLRELAADLLALVDKARAGRLSPLEMQGGTLHHHQPGRLSHRRLHAHHQSARDGDPGRRPHRRQSRGHRRQDRGAHDVHAVAELRPPRGRRRARRRLPGAAGRAAGAAVRPPRNLNRRLGHGQTAARRCCAGWSWGGSARGGPRRWSAQRWASMRRPSPSTPTGPAS